MYFAFGRLGQAEYVRIPLADTGLTVIPDNVSDVQALLAGDILATGYWAAKISEIEKGDDVLVIGAGPTGICSMLCAFLKGPRRVYICDVDETRLDFVAKNYPEAIPLRSFEWPPRESKQAQAYARSKASA